MYMVDSQRLEASMMAVGHLCTSIVDAWKERTAPVSTVDSVTYELKNVVVRYERSEWIIFSYVPFAG